MMDGYSAAPPLSVPLAAASDMHKLRAQLKAARSMPARLVAAKLLRRAGVSTAAVRRAEILANPQTKIADRLTRLYLDFERHAIDRIGWRPIEFEDAHVLEVGCGPLAGLAPLAIAAGAQRYLGIDPGADRDILFHPQTVDRYVAPALDAAAGLLPAASAAATLDAFRDRVDLFAGGLADYSATGPANGDALFTAAASISCLEHIADLDASLANLKRILAPGARQLHLVNFSNHLDKAAPFKHLYDLSPEAHRRRYGAHINLLRPNEMLAAFTAAGFDASLVPVDVRPDAVPENPDGWWTERYSRDELAIRTALIVC